MRWRAIQQAVRKPSLRGIPGGVARLRQCSTRPSLRVGADRVAQDETCGGAPPHTFEAPRERSAKRWHGPGKPVENAYVESFNGKLRNECLNENWFLNLDDEADHRGVARFVLEQQYREESAFAFPHVARYLGGVRTDVHHVTAGLAETLEAMDAWLAARDLLR